MYKYVIGNQAEVKNAEITYSQYIHLSYRLLVQHGVNMPIIYINNRHLQK